MRALHPLAVFVVCAATVALGLAADPAHVIVGDRVAQLTREAVWTRVASIPVAVAAHHPQGMVRIGDAFFVSAVEVTRRRRGVTDGGEGIGHLLHLDLAGKLVRRIRIGEGALYHPGGMDFDGMHLWVSVAEYRPDSQSIVYRVDPGTLVATEVFRFADHLGAVAYDRDDRSLHGVSWGARRFYRWALDEQDRPMNAAAPRRLDNVSHYIDYQDCKYAGRHRMLCTGISTVGSDARPPIALGGLDLVDLADGRPRHQVPIALLARPGVVMTRNPSWVEPHGEGLRAYFMPDDDESAIHVFDVTPAPGGVPAPR